MVNLPQKVNLQVGQTSLLRRSFYGHPHDTLRVPIFIFVDMKMASLKLSLISLKFGMHFLLTNS